MSKIANFAGLIKLLLISAYRFKKQKAVVGRLLKPIINEYSLEDDGSMSSYDYYKISHYYGVGVPILAGGFFEAIFDKKLSDQSVSAMTYMAAVTGLYDDFFDKTGHSKEQIIAMTCDPEKYKAGSVRENVFVAFTLKALEQIENREAIDQSKMSVLEVQWESKAQKVKNQLSWEELKDISITKGGLSLFFYAAGTVTDVSKVQEDLIMRIGGMLQYGNDIFDVHKDLQEGVYTHVNTVQDMRVIKKDFEGMLNALFQKLESSGLSAGQIKVIKQHVLLFSCRALVCLDQFLQLQIANGNKFEVDQFSRKQLVCDMEKPKNALKAINYYLNLLC